MQPLDAVLFKPLKKSYKSAVMKWRVSLNKENFGSVLSKASNQLNLKTILKNRF